MVGRNVLEGRKRRDNNQMDLKIMSFILGENERELVLIAAFGVCVMRRILRVFIHLSTLSESVLPFRISESFSLYQSLRTRKDTSDRIF